MKLKQVLETQNELSISDADMYEWLLNMDKPLASQFLRHLEQYGKLLETVEGIHARFKPGYKRNAQPETSGQIRDRANREKEYAHLVCLNGGKLNKRGQEYLSA